MALLVGTSGYSYRHWSGGIFYPDGLPQRKWLEYYAGYFPTVELNVTFYRLLEEDSFNRWRESTPDDFKFVLKGSRLITHRKRLAGCEDLVGEFFRRAEGLKSKLQAVLWQLPSSQKKDLSRLEHFCRALEKVDGGRHGQVFEFRHPSWDDKAVFETLASHGAAVCLAHSRSYPYMERSDQPLQYLRFHGGGNLYASRYSDNELQVWAEKIISWLREGKTTLAYFNNDYGGYAVENALRLREMVEGLISPDGRG